MANKLPVLSSVLYGEEDRAKADKRRTSVMTLNDLVAPQTVELFTLHFDLMAVPQKAGRC